MSARTYLGFLPWIVFAVVSRGSLEGVAWGAIAALLTAAAIALSSARYRSVKELEIFSLALFVALAIAGALNQHDPQGILQRYHNGLAVGALAVLLRRVAGVRAVHGAVRPRARAAQVLEHHAVQPGQRRAHADVGAGVRRDRGVADHGRGARDRASAPRSSTGSCRSASWCSASARRRCAGATSSTASRWASTQCSTSASSGTLPSRPGIEPASDDPQINVWS